MSAQPLEERPAAAAFSPGLAREWQRFTPAERLGRFAVYFGVVLAIVLSLRAVEIIPEFIADAPAQIKDMAVRMVPPDWAFYPQSVHEALLDTLAIALVATALGLVLAAPVGVLAARNVTPVPLLNALARFVLVATRSISTLLWALFFVAMFGPGALAGSLAIAFHSIGFLGKMLSEALEEAHAGSIEALTAAGASWSARLLYGYWPQIRPTFWGVALFRWDINVRESAVLGLVGAGGIGMVMNAAIDTFKWQQVATVLVAIFAVVIAGEVAVTQIRKRIL